MSCKTEVLNNGTLNNPTINGGKHNDAELSNPSITGGITLDKVTSDELVTTIESDLKKVIKELVDSETFKQLAADKGIFNQGLDVTGNIVLDKVAVQSLVEQLIEETTKAAVDEITKAIKDKFEADLGAIKATGAELTRAKLVNPTIEGAFGLDDAARKTIADVVTTTVVGTLDSLVQDKLDTTIGCWANENFGDKLAFAFSEIREVPVDITKSKAKDASAGPVKEVLDLVFFDITKDKPTKAQYKDGTLPEYVTIVTIDLVSDAYSRSEMDDKLATVNESVGVVSNAVEGLKKDVESNKGDIKDLQQDVSKKLGQGDLEPYAKKTDLNAYVTTEASKNFVDKQYVSDLYVAKSDVVSVFGTSKDLVASQDLANQTKAIADSIADDIKRLEAKIAALDE